jgi:2-methylisocitrate lyase-like PEP mutase family enzyme
MEIRNLIAKTRRDLRHALSERQSWPLLVPGAYDVASARIVEAAGFPAVAVSGFGISATLLGRPDAGYLALPELVYVVSQMARRCSVPLVVDADTGFGNALGVMRTVEELIGAGAAALFIEDQVAPKRCGHVAGKQVISAEEFAGKLRAADRVRRELDPDLVLIARTDSRGVAGGSIDDVVRRGRLYRDAGADIVFPDGLVSADEIELCGKQIGAPLLYNMGGISPRLPLPQLGEWGVFLVGTTGITIQAALRGMWDALHRLRSEGVPYLLEFESSLVGHPVGELQKFVGFPEIRQLEEEFLPAAEVLARYEGSIGYDFGRSK